MEHNLPRHIGIIMDGNGRWAKKRSLPIAMGHRAGFKTMNRIVAKAGNMGVPHLTVFAFSTENIKRPKAEVDALFAIIESGINECIDNAVKNNVKINVIGDVSIFPESTQKLAARLEEATCKNTGLFFHVAINYGGRAEIVRASRKLCEDVLNGAANLSDIDESLFENYLYTSGYPDVDLMIRTSGEFRLSNFLLWQCAYAELYFAEKLWPDFTDDDLAGAISFFNNRERRFGARIVK